ncbi:hypothetical protein [Flectobacillus major]|uniref:hypothetical protein n=1 Tax=Flectobacillus major TaxID=103 RepID=UPI0004216344|nr:hypothetical protein [Flectobacillus major]
MGIFDFLKKKTEKIEEQTEFERQDFEAYKLESLEPLTHEAPPQEIIQKTLPEIPENIFIEKHTPNTSEMNTPANVNTSNDINLLYDYLQQNLEKQGYEDALINPDMQNMNENIEGIKINLFIVISKVKTYYNNHINTINFHIESRERNGMVDTVGELKSLKESAQKELDTVQEIENDAHENSGLSQSLFMSYKKGFRNGLSVISFDTILKRKP